MNEIKSGDILLYHGHGWLSRQIRHWLNIYRRKLHLTMRPLYNHVAVVIGLWGEKYIVEAVAKGIIMRPLHLKLKGIKPGSIKVKTWVEPLGRAEEHRFSKRAVQLATANIEYDFFNFLWYIIKFKVGRWFGPKGAKAQRRLHCSELAAVVMDYTRGTFKGHTWDINPLDIDLCKELKDLN